MSSRSTAAKSFPQINQTRAFTEDVQRNYTGQKRWFSIAPLRNPGFVILIVSNLLTELAQNVPFAYLHYMMVDKGFPKQDTVTVIFFIGKPTRTRVLHYRFGTF